MKNASNIYANPRLNIYSIKTPITITESGTFQNVLCKLPGDHMGNAIKISHKKSYRGWKSLSTDFKNYPRNINICGNCHGIVRERTDYKHGIVFCENCGHVKNTIPLENQEISPENIHVDEEEIAIMVNTFQRVKTRTTDGQIKYNRAPSKFRRITWLKERYDRSTEGNMGLWRLQTQYENYIGVVNTHFMMTEFQKKESLNLILQVGNLKNLCKNCRYEQIVAAICVYTMKKDKRDIRIQRNKFLKEIQLSRNKYAVIIENLAQFFQERHFFHADLNNSL